MANKKHKTLKQAIILRSALSEVGIDPDNCNIRIDHDNGMSYVNEVELPIIFPKNYFDRAVKLHTLDKEYNFYFNGYNGNDSSRKILLEPFLNRTDSNIIWSEDGRDVNKKYNFNEEYFSQLVKSNYGLCPHQLDWPGNKKNLWTYRYIECLMCKVFPVNFKKTPLGKTFIEDSHFVWAEDILKNTHTITDQMLDYNFRFAMRKFTLSKKQIKMIKKRSS